jgi:hypothetical protein
MPVHKEARTGYWGGAFAVGVAFHMGGDKIIAKLN